MTKKKKILIISGASVAAIVLLVAIVAMVLFIPLVGHKRPTVYWTATQKYSTENVATIEKDPSRDFRIMFLTDLQLWFDGKDNKEALQIAKETVEQNDPDLIILGGDNVSGLTTNYLIKDVIEVFESLQIPWAPVFGNHDAEGKATLEWQGDLFTDAKYCMFEFGPDNLDGVGNYAINITENGKIVEVLFLLDTGRYVDLPDGSNGEGGFDYAKLAWYEWNIKGASKAAYGSYNPSEGKVVKSMAFFHFALPEMDMCVNDLKYVDKDGNVKPEYGFGTIGTGICAQKVNTGMFDLALELGSTTDFFFGHDHENDASIVYKGIRMTYGLKTGPSPAPWNSAKRYGGTLITMDSQGKTTVEHKVLRTL